MRRSGGRSTTTSYPSVWPRCVQLSLSRPRLSLLAFTLTLHLHPHPHPRVTKFKINWDGAEGATENGENVPPRAGEAREAREASTQEDNSTSLDGKEARAANGRQPNPFTAAMEGEDGGVA